MTTKSPERPLLRKAEHILEKARRQMGLTDFRFDSKLSVRPLIEYWSHHAEAGPRHFQQIAREIGAYVKKHPSILDAYPDGPTFLKSHEEIVDLFFGSMFPMAMTNQMLGYAAPPFVMRPFYVTPGMQLLLSDQALEIQFEYMGELDKIPYNIRACIIILEKHYKIPLDHVMPLLFRIRHQETTIQRYFKTTSMLDFLEVKTKGTPPKISQEKLDHLLQNMDDVDLWLSSIPPENFYFEGFFLALMNDVTEMETLSRLRKILLAPNPFLVKESAKTVADLTRTYLNLADVEVGISAIDYPAEQSLAHRYNIQYPILENAGEVLLQANRNSIYDRACRLNRMQFISDLQLIDSPAPIEQNYIDQDFRSLMVVPLRDQKKNIIGIMELASHKPFVFTRIKRLKIKEILPLYDIAIEESRQFVENRIQNIIQEQFTNIHPSVHWKFTETAFNYLQSQDDSNELVALKPIRFAGIFPLFGQIDINSSTEIRNRAVKADMLKNLRLVESVLDDADGQRKFHLIKQYAFEVKQKLKEVKDHFDNSLETVVSDLLIEDIHPILRQLSDHDRRLSLQVNTYFEHLDPELEIIFDERAKYEISLNRINRVIGSHLEKQEQINQQLIPHYFEKYKTDGLEYTMYVGQSLLQHAQFSKPLLKNLRLWQLKSMIALYHELEARRAKLPIDMTVSFLILVFNSTISIRFRMEEKRFDVDGAYHIRYAVLKKRVDKALIAGTEERLTNCNKIAIVFIQEKDKHEYLEYIQYLIEEGLLQEKIEEVELEKVQGVQGLKALRVGFVKREN